MTAPAHEAGANTPRGGVIVLPHGVGVFLQGIGAFLADQSIDNVVLVGGDAHVVAIDDGSNSGYGGDDGFPVLQVAALDRRGSVNGGPHSEGEFPGGGRFGVVEVTDTGGDTIGVELTGFDWEGTVLTSLLTTFDVP